MKFKKTFIFICLIVCIFSMASIYAGDVSDGATVSEDTNQTVLSQSSEIEFENDLETSVENDNDENLLRDVKDDAVFYEYYDFPSEIGKGANIILLII